MAENILIATGSKIDKYKLMNAQIVSLTEGEQDLIANLANITAVIKQTFSFFWIGFYIVKQNELVLGPFQGTLACTRISLGKGVCGTSWKNKETIVVPDVDAFPGHIACSSDSKSEIVVPVFNKENEVAMVLDLDSDTYNTFNDEDKLALEELAKHITTLL